MPQFLTDFFSGELKISTTSWHHRLYQYWQDMGGYNRWGYKENLCHYVRVVLFHAPRRWFFQSKVLGGWVRPWLVFLEASVVTAALIPYLIWNIALGLELLAILIGVIAVFFAFDWITRQERTEIILNQLWDKTKPYLVPAAKFLWSCLKAVLKPTWHGICFVCRKGWDVWTPVGDRIYGVGTWIRRWSWEHKDVVPVTILVGLLLNCLAILGWFAYAHLLLFIVVVIIIALIVSVLVGSARLDEWYKTNPDATFPGSNFAKGAVGTVKVAAHFAVAKKRKICPFITFEADDRHLRAA